MVQHPSYPGPILPQDSTDSCGTQRNFAISNLKYLKICKSNGKNACAFCQLKHVAREIHSTLSICSFNFFSVFNTEEHFESDLLTIERPWQKPKYSQYNVQLAVKHVTLEKAPPKWSTMHKCTSSAEFVIIDPCQRKP